jgi:hypothetical protein
LFIDALRFIPLLFRPRLFVRRPITLEAEKGAEHDGDDGDDRQRRRPGIDRTVLTVENIPVPSPV